MNQISFDPLDLGGNKEALKARNEKLRKMRKEGKNVKGWTLTDQLRPYAGFGIPDGRVRNIYYISIY